MALTSSQNRSDEWKEAIKRRPWLGWYSSAAWKKLRIWQLKRQPLCEFCLKAGRVSAADTVDHIRPHRGKMELFFDKNNLQSLDKSCHSSAKQRMEKSGAFGCDENGIVEGWK